MEVEAVEEEMVMSETSVKRKCGGSRSSRSSDAAGCKPGGSARSGSEGLHDWLRYLALYVSRVPCSLLSCSFQFHLCTG